MGNDYYTYGYKSKPSNTYKECNIWMGSAIPSEKNDWRHNTNSGIDVNDAVKLYLDTESLGISYSNSYGDGGQYVPNAVSGAMDIINKVLDSSNALGITSYSAKKVSEYDDPKIWESTGPITFDGDLTFKFWFGSSGLFNALKEVVEPAYAIASMFAPRVNSEGGIQTPLPSKAYWMGAFLSSAIKSLKNDLSKQGDLKWLNADTKNEDKKYDELEKKKEEWEDKQAEIEAEAVKIGIDDLSYYSGAKGASLDGKINSAISSGSFKEENRNQLKSLLIEYNRCKDKIVSIDGQLNSINTNREEKDKFNKNLDSGNLSEDNNDLFKAVADAQAAYFNAIHAGAKRVIAESGYKSGWAIAYLQIGNFKFGPFTATGAKVDFDLKTLDENGWPCSGKVSIQGIQYYKTATDRTLIETAGLAGNYDEKSLKDISSKIRNEKGEIDRESGEDYNI